MEKLALLYEYQQADAKLEVYEKKLKNTATRKQLIKLQNYLKQQQAALNDMEKKALVEQNDLSEIDTQYDRVMELLSIKHKDIGEYEKVDPGDLDYNVVKALVNEYEAAYENAIKQKRKAQVLQRKSDDTAKKLKEMLPRVSKAKKDFATLKKLHAEELRAGADELDKLKKAVELAASKVDKELLKKYKRIKQNKPKPVSMLKDGRCMGCNMELPSRDLANIKKPDIVVECENCGRILYLK